MSRRTEGNPGRLDRFEKEQVAKDFKDVPLVPREAGFGPLALGSPGRAAHHIAGLSIQGQH